MTQKSSLETVSAVATLLGGMLIVAGLFVARDVFIPLTLAVLLSFLLSPVVNRVQRLGVRNIFAVLGTAVFVFVILAGTLTFVGRELSNLVSDIPHYKSELISKARGLAGLRSGMGERFDALAKEVTAAIEDPTKKVDESNANTASGKEAEATSESLSPLKRFADRLLASDTEKSDNAAHDGKTPSSPIYISSVNPEPPVISWAGTVGNILGPLGTAGLVTVFVLFLLIYREDMRNRIMKVISNGNYVTTTEALDEVSRRISKYLVAQTIVNTLYGFTFGLGLYFIGRFFAPDGNFPNFALWGTLATILRFVPYIGPVAAAAFPILLSVAVFPGYSVTIGVVTIIVVIELACNNILEPWLYGTSTGLSSVAIILAAVFWGWLWGPVGLLLSTPLTVCLVVLGQYVPRFRVFATLLGEKVAIAPSLLFYQRLLSKDQLRATEILDSCIKEDGAMTAIDKVLVPTLRRVRRDLEAEHLMPEQAAELSQSIETVVENAKWLSKEDASNNASNNASNIVSCEVSSEVSSDDQTLRKLNVLAIPAHLPSEELLLSAFAKANPLLSILISSNNELPDQFADHAVQENPEAIVIYVLPQGGFTQSKYLCRTVRAAGYTGTIIICCSGKFRNFDRLFVKFRKAGANFMTTSLKQTAQKLLGLKIVDRKSKNKLAPQLL